MRYNDMRKDAFFLSRVGCAAHRIHATTKPLSRQYPILVCTITLKWMSDYPYFADWLEVNRPVRSAFIGTNSDPLSGELI